jgi:hypothetical protein
MSGYSCFFDPGVALLQRGSFLEAKDPTGVISMLSGVAEPAPVKESDLATAGMLLMFTVAISSLFYLTNAKSSRIRGYTWTVLDTTLSIVIAIMLFEAVKDATYLVVGTQAMTWNLTNFALALVCTGALQLMSLAIVQAQGTWEVHTGTKAVEVSLRLIRTRAFSGTCGRFCGFAWITFWAMQQVEPTIEGHNHTRWADIVPFAAALIGLALMAAFRVLRHWIIFRDGIVDPEEKAWELQTCRIEIDGFSLCCSFVIAQVARYYIGGIMPAPTGTEQHGSTAGKSFAHPAQEIARLLVLALSFKCFSVFTSVMVGDNPPHSVDDWTGWARWVGGLLAVNTFSKTTGWLLLFSTGWTLFGFLPTEDPDSSVQVRTILALICSYLSFFVIGMLDAAPGGKQRWKDETLASMGLMTGFSWRRCYGLTIDFFTATYGTRLIPSEPKNGEHLMEICLSLPFVAILMPAHYLYIVPNAIAASMT